MREIKKLSIEMIVAESCWVTYKIMSLAWRNILNHHGKEYMLVRIKKSPHKRLVRSLIKNCRLNISIQHIFIMLTLYGMLQINTARGFVEKKWLLDVNLAFSYYLIKKKYMIWMSIMRESNTMIQVPHFYNKYGLDVHFIRGMILIQDDTWICWK